MTFSISLGFSLASPPFLTGVPEVGSTLRVAPFQMEGTSPLTYSIRWLRNGAPISGATSISYTVTAADEGTTISLRLTLPDGSQQTSANSLTILAAAAPQESGATATLDAFVRDRIVFDTGAARGADAAEVPLSGATDAPDGAGIMAQVLHAGTGDVVRPAVQVATAANGAWAGAIPGVRRDPAWMKARIWVAGNEADAVESDQEFGAGHVIALWGQSEIQNLVVPFYDGAGPAEVVSADEMVSFHWHNRNPDATGSAGITHQMMTAADGFNTRLPAMANSLIAALPGQKIAVILQTDSGTGFSQLVTDAPNGRAWNDDRVLHDEATGGGHVGLAAFDWYAAPRTYGSQYAQALHQITFGTTIDGTDITAGGAPYAINGGTFDADHLLTELYDYSHTKVAVLEPHRFEVGNTASIVACRNAVRGMMGASPKAADGTLVHGHPVLHYRNADTSDIAHPQAGEGSTRFGIGLLQSAIRAMGLTDWAYPIIDNAFWEPSGAYVELWSSAGPITALDTSRITGVLVNGAHVDGTLAAGRIRVTSAAAGALTSSTLLEFAPVSTGLSVAEEYYTGWRNMPVVDLGVSGMEGVPLGNAPDPAILVSTVAGASSWVIAGGNDAVQLGANDFGGLSQRLTFEADVAAQAAAATSPIILQQSGFSVETLTSNGNRFRVSAPGISNQTTAPGIWKPGVRQKIKLVIDQTTGRSALYVDGAEVLAGQAAAVTGQAYPVRYAGNFTSGAWQAGMVGTVYALKAWIDDATFAGADPAAAPTYVIEGDLPAMIADAQAYNGGGSNIAIVENGTRVDNA